jgi:hypothetical protein
VTRPEVALTDPAAFRRMEALREVSRTKDEKHVPQLIEMLDDEDPGVRLMAGAVLTDVTGHQSAYQAHAGPVERRDQMLAWRSWWTAEGGGAAPAGTVPPQPSPTAAPSCVGEPTELRRVSMPTSPRPPVPPPPPPPLVPAAGGTPAAGRTR